MLDGGASAPRRRYLMSDPNPHPVLHPPLASPRRPSSVAWWGLVATSVAMLAGCAAAPPAPARPVPALAPAEPAWAPWSAESFARAEREHRILLINVVASWCHWCHVMEEETYADPTIASLLRDHFVTIRVDSDARPDLAERYRAWGWPATAVLSPSAQPILELRGFQEPARFEALLRELIAERDAGSLVRRGPARPRPSTTEPPSSQRRQATTTQLDGFFEPERGGWGKVQKYPFPEPVEHALVRGKLHGDDGWRARALQTLEGSAKLVDPVWGGMYQYSLRGDWDHPHYEKITAIQAGAIGNFAMAARVSDDDAWLGPASAIIEYMNTFMRAPEGGYYTSQDADLRLEDGPHVVGKTFYAGDDAQRRRRGIPRIDDNVYADLNGMMVRGLVEYYVASARPAALDDAIEAAGRVLRTHRSRRGGVKHGPDFDDEGLLYLRDQAAMMWGLLALYHATSEPRWLNEAQVLGDFMLESLQDPDDGGFWSHTPDPDAVGVFAQRRKPLEENGLAARALLRLHRYLDGDGTEDSPYLEPARRALAAVGDPRDVRREGRIVGTYLLALEELEMPIVDITVVGHVDDPATAALYRAALHYPEPRAIVERSAPGTRYPDLGAAAVYLCTANTCSPPIRDPRRLAERAQQVLDAALPPVP